MCCSQGCDPLQAQPHGLLHPQYEGCDQDAPGEGRRVYRARAVDYRLQALSATHQDKDFCQVQSLEGFFSVEKERQMEVLHSWLFAARFYIPRMGYSKYFSNLVIHLSTVCLVYTVLWNHYFMRVLLLEGHALAYI